MNKKNMIISNKPQEKQKDDPYQSPDDLDIFSFNDMSSDENRIYFYAEVTRDSVLSLNTKIREMNNTLICKSIKLECDPANIYLHINSQGGDLFAGLIASDYIKKSKIPIITIIDGVAASAATLMSVVGRRRQIYENSFMLIHQLSSTAWGKYEEIKDEMRNCEALMNSMVKIYKQYTKIPQKKLQEMLQRDIWLTAEECKKWGLVDDIL